ncbi:sugar ABC transporter substrate-binding protein [Evansella halocellulosilytica]|uniref:sugar ABC transporter substrate-binding protein n=1 Tax=Evansella halocellulosilytica TaxID=2011013 RepID=UPI000BB7C3A6|nr:extracellular solute-binding protein [Evansella halocellulosilytica]
MKKAHLYLFSLLFSLIFIIVACGPDDSETFDEEVTGDTETEEGEQGEDASVPEKPETLEIWANDDEYQYAAVEHLVSQFEEEHGIDVTVTPYLMADQDEAFALDAPGGIGPDVIFQPHDRLGNLVTQGLLAPIEIDEEVLGEYTEDAVTAFTFDGEVYGAPLVMENTALYYNKDLVDEVPETMDELYDLAEQLTDASNDEYGFLFEALNFYHIYPWLGGYNGYVFEQDEDGNYDIDDIGLNNEGAVQAYSEIQSLFDRGILPRSVDEDVINGLFTDGKVGMVVSGPWALASFSDALGDSLGVVPMPALSNGEQPTPFAGVKGWLVSNYSDSTYWASQLALHLTTADSQAYYYEETGEIPARPDADIDSPYAEGFLEQSQTAIPMPNIPEMDQVWDAMEDSLQYNADGDEPEEVLNEAVEEIHEFIHMMQ